MFGRCGVTLTGEWTSYRRLRAPTDDGAHLVEPPLEDVGSILADNQSAPAADCDLIGRSISELRHEAKRDLLAAAQSYVGQYVDIERLESAADVPVILTGHQAQLFHPGVWYKNFLAEHIARQHGGVALHIIIDADLFGSPSIRVPTGTVDAPRWQTIEFDSPTDKMPAEERRLLDADRFSSFGKQVQQAIEPLVTNPLVASLWPTAVERSRQTEVLGQCLAQSRHIVERQWGSKTLEIPQSTASDLNAFAWLTAHLLTNLPRLHEVYNNAARDYRREHRIRTNAHPVPDLREEGDWLEAPFWIWTNDDPSRRPLWVSRRGKLTVSDRAGSEHELGTSADADGDHIVERLTALRAQGVKIRPRALINTLYCRLLLSDLFIHGIGGAKYDQLTDQIIVEFFGVAPPAYGVATGTLRLPIERPRVSIEDARGLDHELRGLTYHPETFLDGSSRDDAEVARWVEQKRRWIATTQTPANARQRYLEIREANTALQSAVASKRARLLKCRDEVATALKADALIGSREWSFCLYPEDQLRSFLSFGA